MMDDELSALICVAKHLRHPRPHVHRYRRADACLIRSRKEGGNLGGNAPL